MKRERMLQVVVGLLGLLYVALLYPLYRDLAHSSWLLEMKNECDPMFLSWFVALGPFLLLAARKPSSHRSLIAFAACQSLVHSSVMTIQTVEAWNHGVHAILRTWSLSASSAQFAGTLTGKTQRRAHSLHHSALRRQ